MNTKSFYEILFNEDEYTCFGDNEFAIKGYLAIEKGIKEDNRYFTINPLMKGATRSDSNVSAYRNLMFEIDDQKDENDKKVPVPKKTQATIIHRCGLPFSTCLDTGNKSLHWILSLQDDFITDKTEYVAVWRACQEVINKTAFELGHNLEIDDSTKNPSRFSRAAGALRTDKVEKPAIQTIKSLRGRIHSDELFAWLESHGIDWVDFMPKPKNIDANTTYNVSATDQEKIDFVLKWKMKDDRYEDSNKHNYQVKFAYNLLRTGMDSSAVDATLINMFGEISTGIRTTAKLAETNLGPPIYVWSKEEKLAWVKEQKRIEAEEEAIKFAGLLVDADDDVITNGDVANLNAGGLHQYIRVATKYYRADDYSIDLWDKQTIKDDFGTRSLHDEALRKFRGFVNEPNYLQRVEYVTRMIGGQPQSFYNKFHYPNWNLVKGEFPTVMKLLNKVFIGDSEDHLEIGLDWIQLTLTKPKQRTRALVLVGPTEVGKDTFMEWLINIVGANGILIGGEEIESQYNSSWAGKHLVCLNEVSYDLSDKKTKERIKNLLTAEKLTVEGKGDNRYQIENHTKIIMSTNNMYDFMKIDNTENRFWVREMPPLKKSDVDTRFTEKLAAEKSAFLYWITKERKLWRTEKATRFWHSNEECSTEAGRRVVENTKSTLYSAIQSQFQDRFNTPQMQGIDVMYVRAKTLTQYMNKDFYHAKDKYSEKAVKMCLLKEFGIKDYKTIREDAFSDFESSNNSFFSIFRTAIEDPIALPENYYDQIL